MRHSAFCVEIDAGCRGVGIQAVGERRAATVHLQDGTVHEDAQGDGTCLSVDGAGRCGDLRRLQFLDCPPQVAAPGGGWVGVDLLRAEQAVDADAIPCRLVPDAGAPAVTPHPHRGTEPVGAGAPQIDRQLQFQGIAGYLYHVAPGAGDDRQVPLPVERTPQSFNLGYRTLDQFVAGQLQDPWDAVRADPVGRRVDR